MGTETERVGSDPASVSIVSLEILAVHCSAAQCSAGPSNTVSALGSQTPSGFECAA